VKRKAHIKVISRRTFPSSRKQSGLKAEEQRDTIPVVYTLQENYLLIQEICTVQMLGYVSHVQTKPVIMCSLVYIYYELSGARCHNFLFKFAVENVSRRSQAIAVAERSKA
jgi:hypothetical protein